MSEIRLRDRTALVLYGSETGNSEDVAHQLGCLLERLHFKTQVFEMNSIEASTLVKSSIVIFTLSTAGQGEFPKNALKLWKSLLRKSLSQTFLSHVLFTTFGLGDSSYSKFNISARKLHKRLLQLGAKEFYPAGEADDQHPEGIDGTYLSWSHNLKLHLQDAFPLPEGLAPIPPDVFLPPKHHLEIDNELNNMTPSNKHTDLTDGERVSSTSSRKTMDPTVCAIETKMASGEDLCISSPQSETRLDCDRFRESLVLADFPIEKIPPSTNEHINIPSGYNATLRANNRVTPYDHFQDVRELTFTINGEVPYQPGDSIIIYPKNFPEDVERLISIMDWQTVADKPLKFEPDHPDYYGDEWLVSAVPHLYPIPHSTLRQLLTHNLDITAIPKRRFFEMIAQYTENPTHRERLLEFANPLFIDEFYDYTSRPRRSILEVLEDFTSVRLPWRHITSIIPVIRGRAYSIASGGAQKLLSIKGGIVTSITILVAIVKYKTVLRKIRQGLCSRYLASLERNLTIEIEIERSGSFYNLARINPKLPLILVATGTGIAPCRSLILEREGPRCKSSGNKEGIEIGKHFLFFGGRNRNADFFYEHDWMAKCMLTKTYPVFSRDQSEKIYVQDKIRQETQLIATLILQERAIVYVCGSSGKMPRGVKEAFISALMSCDHEALLLKAPFTRETAVQKLDEMVKTGYYVQETW
ncbi:NADPH-dependent diflavin oxidoreductase 1 [Golovinomyces cichoracearum]|uniref:NADPH-dependent diflavin oxidoreductase 1 n=1 Tax=Golovinomyces cichoracearum TaxID=62708 RepID=A0A420IG93_9PEZI|nr:NADPH-dependent diflavin oxidoreductase 1 [Golovinomyces cichoracearum]